MKSVFTAFTASIFILPSAIADVSPLTREGLFFQRTGNLLNLVHCSDLPSYLSYPNHSSSMSQIERIQSDRKGNCLPVLSASKDEIIADREKHASDLFNRELRDDEISQIKKKLDIDLSAKYEKGAEDDFVSSAYYILGGYCEETIQRADIIDLPPFTSTASKNPPNSASNLELDQLIKAVHSKCKRKIMDPKFRSKSNAELFKWIDEYAILNHGAAKMPKLFQSYKYNILRKISPSKTQIESAYDIESYEKQKDKCWSTLNGVKNDLSQYIEKNIASKIGVGRFRTDPPFNTLFQIQPLKSGTLYECTKIFENLLNEGADVIQSFPSYSSSTYQRDRGFLAPSERELSSKLDNSYHRLEGYPPLRVMIPDWFLDAYNYGRGEKAFSPFESGKKIIISAFPKEGLTASNRKLPKVGSFYLEEKIIPIRDRDENNKENGDPLYSDKAYEFFHETGKYGVNWYIDSRPDGNIPKATRNRDDEIRKAIIKAMEGAEIDDEIFFAKKTKTIKMDLPLQGLKFFAELPHNAILAETDEPFNSYYSIEFPVQAPSDKHAHFFMQLKYGIDYKNLETGMKSSLIRNCNVDAASDTCTIRTCREDVKLIKVKKAKFGTIYRAKASAKDECDKSVKSYTGPPVIYFERNGTPYFVESENLKFLESLELVD